MVRINAQGELVDPQGKAPVNERPPRPSSDSAGRQMSLALKLQVIVGQFPFLLILGSVFAGFATIIAIVFLSTMDVKHDLGQRDYSLRVEGLATRVVENRNQKSKSTYYTLDYHYEIDGTRFTGRARADRKPETGPITVMADRKDPAYSVIPGMRRDGMPIWAGLFFLPFFGVGVGIVAFQVRRGIRCARLMMEGTQTSGRFTGEKKTSVRVNNRVVMKSLFAYTDQQGTERTTGVNNYRRVAWEADQQVTVFYDAQNPKLACVLEMQPGNPQLSDDGRSFIGGSAGKVMAMLIAPMLALVGIAIAAAVVVFVK